MPILHPAACAEISGPSLSLNRVLAAALIVAATISAGVFLYSLPLPLIDQHGFRQAQTAMSVDWMLRGGSWFDYLTPVLGAPWRLPFEFPLFHWIVAALVMVTGLPLDAAGRSVSYLWLLAAIAPAAALVRSYRLPPATTPLFAALLLTAPVYLFWGRAFLMETQAVALGLMQVALVRAWVLERQIGTAVLASLASAACILTKVTTALPFFCLAGLVVAERLRHDRGPTGWCLGALIFLPGLLMFAAWTAHADAIKAAHPLTALLVSRSPGILAWNFGTLEQRLGVPMLVTLVRALLDIAGPLLPLVPYILIRALLAQARGQGVAATIVALVGCWLLPFLIFTNLHVVHNYYQAANAVFLVGALAVALAALSRSLPTGVLAVLLTALMTSQAARFATAFAPSLVRPEAAADHRLASTVRAVAPPGVLLVVGRDWSPIIPYYAGRKAIMLSSMLDEAGAATALADLPKLRGGERLGAVLVCPPERGDLMQDRDLALGMKALTAPMRSRPVGQGCRLFTS